MWKQLLPLSLLIACFFSVNPVFTQTIFVDGNAIGLNDGSSWSNAYIDLTDALVNANTGDAVWIAAGSYLPGSGILDTFARFAIESPISIYGGFVGTETAVEQRDLINNITILDGDLAGNDPIDDYELNRDDNALHVVYIDSLLTTPVILDGLTIRGGYNHDGIDGVSDYFWRGAGIYTYSAVEVRNCTFTRNRSESGAGIYLNGSNTDNSLFENNTFIENRGTGQGALFLFGADNITVNNCDFLDNLCNRGALYPNSCNNVTVENCLFENNVNPTGFGGAVFSWQNYGLFFEGCTFRNNQAQSAGGMYIDGRDDTDFDIERVKINNCLFDGNASVDGSGGVIYFWMASYTLTDSEFTDNQSASLGGAVASFGENKTFHIDNCQFSGNTANFGGALTNYALGTTGTVENCTFTENVANTSGGAAINGFKVNMSYQNCTYEANRGGWGGAMYSQNDTTIISIEDCYFSGNNCDNLGGALNISDGVVSTIENCVFEGNQGGTGGAIHIEDGENNQAEATLNRLSFLLNTANGDQGGALNVSDVNLSLSNSLFVFNIANGLGTGGAISLNASDTSSALIINNTFADNVGDLAAGIASWTPDTTGQLTITMQNNFMRNGGLNYAIEAGTPILLSGGGNYISDASMNTWLTESTDQLEATAAPMFVDEDDFDFHLLENSPLINAGVASGAPAVDLDGVSRDANPDIGSYEFDFTSDLSSIIDQDNSLNISPNPLQDRARLSLENEWRGKVTISVFDAQGRALLHTSKQKSQQLLEWEMDVTLLNAGSYWLVIEQADARLASPLIKH